MTPKDHGAPERCLNADCREPLDQKAGSGRTRLYCGDACGKAYRKARNAARTPEVRAHDQYAAQITTTLGDRTRQLQHLVESGSPLDTLQLLVRITKDNDDLRDAVVQQARDRGYKAADIAHAMSIGSDKLGRDHPAGSFERRMRARQERCPSSHPPKQAVELPPSAPETRGTTWTSCPAADDAEGPPDQSPEETLTLALSHLVRSSTKTFRELSGEIGVSASYISRILAGERRPSWKITSQLVHSAGGDPVEIRPLWDAARGRHAPQPGTLSAALRGLYLAAARPRLTDVCRQSGHLLQPSDIQEALDGRLVPDWTVVDRLVGTLHGQPETFRPLWAAARTSAKAEHPPIRYGPLAESF